MPAPHLLAALLADPTERPGAVARIRRAYDLAGGAHGQAAEALGITAAGLHKWRQRYPEVEAAVADVRERHGYRLTGGPRKSTSGR